MAFSDEVVKDGRGVAVMMDISFDGFATISYRWATHALVDGSGNQYSQSLDKVGNLSRDFGNDNVVSVSNMEMVVFNQDGRADWMLAGATAIQTLQALVNLYLVIYDPVAGPSFSLSTTQKKQIGQYQIADNPIRTNDEIRFTLTDAVLGLMELACQGPTMADFFNTIPIATNPLKNIKGLTFGINNFLAWPTDLEMQGNGTWNQPIPIAFGRNPVECILPTQYCTFGNGGSWDATPANNVNVLPVFFCATRSNAALGPQGQEVEFLYVEIGSGIPNVPPGWYVVPLNYQDISGIQRQIFTVYSEGSVAGHNITIDGKTWTVKWLGLNLGSLAAYLSGVGFADLVEGTNGATWFQSLINGGGAATTTPPYTTQAYKNGFVKSCRVDGWPLSGITNATAVGQHPVDIVTDLATSYSKAGAANIDTVSASRLKAYQPGWVATVQLQSASSTQAKKLRQLLGDLAGTFGFDIYSSWGGLLSFSTFWRDNTAIIGTPVVIPETRLQSPQDSFASREQRWAPFNRIQTTGSRDGFINQQGNALLPGGGMGILTPPPPGPFDDPGGSITAWRRINQRTINVACLPDPLQRINPWTGGASGLPYVKPEMRPIFEWGMDVSGLLNEMGDIVSVTWTRGGGLPIYQGVWFQLESIHLNLDAILSTGLNKNHIQFRAVYRGDLTAVGGPYILDDDSQATGHPLLRVAPTGGRTVTVTDASSTVVGSAGSFITDGVQVGDHLVLQDPTEATAGYQRNRFLKIASVVDATHLTISDTDLIFTAPGGVAVSNWVIMRSHLTYPTNATDPTHYPNGSNQYGCITNSTGVFSGLGTRGFTQGQQLN